jgi:hypothetical protein
MLNQNIIRKTIINAIKKSNNEAIMGVIGIKILGKYTLVNNPTLLNKLLEDFVKDVEKNVHGTKATKLKIG